MSDIIADLRDAMRANGIDVRGDIIADGKIHRYYAEGDRRGSRNAWIVLHTDGTPSAGFGSMRGGEKFKWSARGSKPLTREERDKLRAEIAANKARREQVERDQRAEAAAAANRVWSAATDAGDHPYLRRKGVASYGLKVGTWVRDYGSDQTTGEVREHRIASALLVPIRNSRREIVSLQAIFPNNKNPLKRDKDYLAGGEKRGCFFSIGKPGQVEGRTVIVLVEGYATGASVHAATGLGVIVCFDAVNLLPVAEIVRRLMPAATILFAADNDAFTVIKEVQTNVGVLKAMEAAAAVSGVVVFPRFKDVASKPSDWNDLHVLEGEDEVRRQVLAGLNRPRDAAPPVPAAPDQPEPPPHDDVPQGPEPEAAAPAAKAVPKPAAAVAEDDEDEDAGPTDAGGYFTILGHDRDRIYVYQHEKKMVTMRGESSWDKNALMSIAPLQWWEMNFAGEKGLNKDAAINWLIRTAFKRGYYDPSLSRGRGAWLDEKRIVYHFGHMLTVDGEQMGVAEVKSRYVYEQGRHLPLPSGAELTDAEGRAIFDIAKQFRWTRPSSAVLLAGWVFLAPICGALRWRPHIWLTGGAGSGKAQPHSAKVLAPDGWRTMGEIHVGDYVSTPDDGYARVFGVFPQGEKPVYKLTFADGRTTRATGDHLWKVRVKQDWRIRTTDQMIEILARDTRSSISLAIPLSDPMTIAGNNKCDLPLHPYVLGAFLGDGYLGGANGTDSIKITSYDPEIVERIRGLLPEGSALFDRGCVPYEFRLGDLSRYGRKTRQIIKDLRLIGKRSADKFIPQEYLDASVENRIELLKGLMDTDGTIGDGGSMSFCTVSSRLCDDFVYLVRSLGGIASVAEKSPTYTHDGEKRAGQLAYQINIRLPDRSMAFSLPRKLARANTDYQYEDCLYLNVASIEPDGVEECSCIAIDHPDRLYVTDDFVVTHNTTILNDYVHYLMNGAALYAQGNSTEAGVRQTLRNDALPVLFDETEQNNEREMNRMQAVLSLIRQSSTESEAKTLKGTQHGSAMDFMIRSIFCLSSIQVGIKHQADYERIAILALRPKREAEDASADWQKLKTELARLRADRDLPARMLRRSLNMLPVILANIDTFATAGASRFGSQREGDQYGALLAGAWSLVCSRQATLEEAERMIGRYDWSEYLENSETDESAKALSALMGAMIRMPRGESVTVHELARRAVGLAVETVETAPDQAGAILRRHGLAILHNGGGPEMADMLVSNNSVELAKLLEGTPFAADLKGQLLRVQGARRHEKPVSFNGVKDRCVAIPMSAVLGDERPSLPVYEPGVDDEVPF